MDGRQARRSGAKEPRLKRVAFERHGFDSQRYRLISQRYRLISYTLGLSRDLVDAK
jgi:hypothetical protein